VTSIGEYAFYEFKNLKGLSLPESIEIIAHSAFQGSGIQSIYLPKNVSFVASYVFFQCYNLTTITVDSANEYFKL